MDERDGVIEALKISNDSRQEIIDGLVAESAEKDKEFTELKRQLKLLEGVIDRSREKKYWTTRGKKDKGQGT